MERHLKERMVGAGVLIAVAIILIPEMLSGPRSTATNEPASNKAEQQVVAADDVAKLKTYTIDLAKPAVVKPTESAAPAPSKDSAKDEESGRGVAVVSTPAPPAEDSRPSAVPKPEPAQQREPQQNKVPDKPAKSATTTTASADVSPMPTPNASGGWAVQVGSFGVRATSERIASDLKTQGFSAFVVAFHNGNQTMFRVRVGPERDRAAAEALLRKVKVQHPNATLVPPP